MQLARYIYENVGSKLMIPLMTGLGISGAVFLLVTELLVRLRDSFSVL